MYMKLEYYLDEIFLILEYNEVPELGLMKVLEMVHLLAELLGLYLRHPLVGLEVTLAKGLKS